MLNLVNNTPGNKIRGRKISLINFNGKIELKSNLFMQNYLKYVNCDIGQYFEDPSILTNNDLQSIIKDKINI